jgi:hypothetical protein
VSAVVTTRLVGEYFSGRAQGRGQGECIDTDVGANVQGDHSRLGKAIDKIDFALEPFALFQKNKGADAKQIGGNGKLESLIVAERYEVAAAVHGISGDSVLNHLA